MGTGSLDIGDNDGVVWPDALSLGSWTSQVRKCAVAFLPSGLHIAHCIDWSGEGFFSPPENPSYRARWGNEWMIENIVELEDY